VRSAVPAQAESSSPAAAAEPVEMTDMEAITLYNCLSEERAAAYALSGNPVATSYTDWPRFSIRAYPSESHGGRHLQNYANAAAKAYAKWEQAGTMPAGTQLAADSFTLHPEGTASVGPLFLMEKMEAGFNPDSEDWKYTLIMPDGSTVGTTGGEGSTSVEFCFECHKALSSTDSMLLVPPDLRGG